MQSCLKVHPLVWPCLGALPQPTNRAARIVDTLARFAPISLAEMDAVALMSRIDTKYLMDTAQWHAALAALADDYRVLEIDGVRLHRYVSLYFDTADLMLYACHHVGRSERFKVRSRSYLDSGISFFEVKHKTNKGRTIKDRMRTMALLTRLTPEAGRFVDRLTPLDVETLQPRLWTEFSRITLVSQRRPERVTLDLELRYRASGASIALPAVIVAEVKQESIDRESGLVAQMRALGIHPTPLSKYCIGTALLRPDVKHNRFKPVLRQMDRIMRGGHDVE